MKRLIPRSRTVNACVPKQVVIEPTTAMPNLRGGAYPPFACG
jgi:hypothetical protein